MSENSASVSTPLPASTTGVGLGYGIGIAVGILVLVSSIMLASYICVRIASTTSGGPGHVAARAPSFSAGPTAVLGLDGPTIESYYPKFAYARHVSPAAAAAGPCAICLGEYLEGEMVRRVPECAHCFHVRCVDEWLRVSATCPVCRSSPIPSPAFTPVGTPLSELIPLAVHPR